MNEYESKFDAYIPYQPFVMRAIEVAMVTSRSLTVISSDKGLSEEILKFHAFLYGLNVAPPCPCGNYGDELRPCRCSVKMVAQFQNQIMLYRSDMYVKTSTYDSHQSMKIVSGESESFDRGIFDRVRTANKLYVDHPEIVFTEGALNLYKAFYSQRFPKFSQTLSVRKIAKSVACLAGREAIDTVDMAEALQYLYKE